MSSDGITWEVCPVCGLTAAVGWTGGHLAEFDCTNGCLPTMAQVRDLDERQGPPLNRLQRS
jgi:hypothetical protein